MYDQKGTVFQSVSLPNYVVPLTPKKTAGHSDCPFHAMLGEWDAGEKKFVCTDVATKRKQAADVIRGCLASEPCSKPVRLSRYFILA